MSGLLLLKYISSALAVGIAFLGSWFFEFTVTDKNSGRRTLTPFGRIALLASTIALILAATSTIWTDYEASRKESETEARLVSERRSVELEQQKSERFRLDSEKDRGDSLKLLGLINDSLSGLSAGERRKTLNVIEGLSSAEDYRRQYPDLYNRLLRARNFGELSEAVGEGLERKIAERVSLAPECQGITLKTWSNTPVRTGHFSIRESPAQAMSFAVNSDGIEFEVSDLSGIRNLKNGYTFLFADGEETPKLSCSIFGTSISCKDSTARSSTARSVYLAMQKKIISKVKFDGLASDIAPNIAKQIQKTFSCISP